MREGRWSEMRVLICGDREWVDSTPIQHVFDRLDVTVCIHGGARGADSLAGREAALRGIPVEVYPADWRRYGKGAGPVRNQQMLDEGKPEYVVAFHSDMRRSRGTADMIRRAEAAGIPVQVIV